MSRSTVLTADFALPTGAFSVTTGDGAAWVAAGNTILRVDPHTDRSRQVLSMPGDSLNKVVFGGGDLWVAAASGLLRVNPATGKVTGRLGLVVGDLAYGDGYLWGIRLTELARITPSTLVVRSTPLKLGKYGGLAAGDGAVWISATGDCVGAEGCVLRINPASGRVTSRIEGELALAEVALGDGAVWASDGTTFEKIDPATNTIVSTTALVSPLTRSSEVRVLYGSGLLAVSPDAIWVTVSTSFARAGLDRLNPTTGHLVGDEMKLGASPSSIAAVGDTVWIITGQDALTRIDLVSCRAMHCSPPAPPAPRVPEAASRPLELMSLQMFSSEVGWALAYTANPGESPSTTAFPARTADGGRSWTDVMPPTGSMAHPSPTVLFALDAARVWLAVSSGAGGALTTIFTSDDGGNVWSRSPTFRTGGYLKFLEFTDPTHGWLLVDIGGVMGEDAVKIYRTTDGGGRWSLVARSPSFTSPNGASLGGLPLYCDKAGLIFANPQAGWVPIWCAGGDELLLQTTDGGLRWTGRALEPPVSECEPYEVSDLQFHGSTGYAVLPGLVSARLLVSLDSGVAWSAVDLPAGSGRSPDVQFVDSSAGFLVASDPYGSDGVLFRTTDAGRSWQRVQSNLATGQLDFVSEAVGFAWGGEGEGVPPLSATTDGGQDWISFTPNLTS